MGCGLLVAGACLEAPALGCVSFSRVGCGLEHRLSSRGAQAQQSWRAGFTAPRREGPSQLRNHTRLAHQEAGAGLLALFPVWVSETLQVMRCV